MNCACCYGAHVGPCCPGWGHFESSRGDEVEACDECRIFPNDDAARRAHDTVCACAINERTRRRLSARPHPAPTILVPRLPVAPRVVKKS